MSEAESTQADESLKSSVKSAKAQVDGLKELVPQQLTDELKLGTTLLKKKASAWAWQRVWALARSSLFYYS